MPIPEFSQIQTPCYVCVFYLPTLSSAIRLPDVANSTRERSQTPPAATVFGIIVKKNSSWILPEPNSGHANHKTTVTVTTVTLTIKGTTPRQETPQSRHWASSHHRWAGGQTTAGMHTSSPVGRCLASLTLAKFPLPMVLSSWYLPMCGSESGRLRDDSYGRHHT